MADNKFFISHNDTSSGPFTLAEIRAKLKAQTLSYIDFIWSQEDWVMLAHFFAAEISPPKMPPPGVKTEEKVFSGDSFQQDLGISNEPIWFLYRDKMKFGPYRYLELVRLLKASNMSAEDFVWKPGFADWQRIRQCPEFSEGMIQKLGNIKNFGLEKVFIQRRFPRIPYEGEVILQDEQSLLFGSAKTISEGGAFVQVETIKHAKGDRIKVHFTSGAVQVPFNCIAEITQVKKEKPRGYNVKFIYLEEEDRKRIAQYAESKASRSAG